MDDVIQPDSSPMAHSSQQDGGNSDDSEDEEVFEDDTENRITSTTGVGDLIDGTSMDADDLQEYHNGTVSTIALPKSRLRILEEYRRIMNYMDDEFRSDLALHLYAVHLLHIRNQYYPNRKFTDWPLSEDEMPPVKQDFEAEFGPDRFTQYTDVCNDSGKKKPEGYMLEFYNPHVSAVEDMKQTLDILFERKIGKKIIEHNQKHADDREDNGQRRVFQATVGHDIRIPDELKDQLFNRLNGLLDSLIMMRRNQLVSDNSKVDESINLPLDWHDVSSTLGNPDERLQLRQLFSLIPEKNPCESDPGHRIKANLHAMILGRDLVKEGIDKIHGQLMNKRHKLDEYDDEDEDITTLSVFTRRDRESLSAQTLKKRVQ
ncbi:hypothetical protein FOA43_004341 [Brettanomyces nanus]|uniref:Uncharacterized protein n=1 Tax=Eeniella nana TaxID=13502 RepID=A0A875RXL7_EENNA|nr:uncharacterized protein FOA43_004341 [Brettanomyces nanus]QPG76947.1 hypothetical protein FOA43_004341 [Brettanomyces nanus]